MIKATAPLDELHAREQRTAPVAPTWERAAEIFLALWSEAQLLNPDLGSDWLEDVQCDISIARTLNGLAKAV